VYLTGPYRGAPFGLSIVVPAKAGTFNLGNEVIRAQILINPITAQVTVVTDRCPRPSTASRCGYGPMNTEINEGFVLNPSGCAQKTISATIKGSQNTTANVSSSVQPANCQALSFKPSLAVSTQGKASKANGASLHCKISYPQGALGSESWFSEAKFEFPKQLPSRLTKIQKACLAATFEVNPDSWPHQAVDRARDRAYPAAAGAA